MKNASIMKSNQLNENYLNASKVLVVNPTTEDLTNKFYAAGPNVRIGDALFTVCKSSYYSDDNNHNDHIELHRRADWIASALNAYRVAENNASDVGIKDVPRKIILGGCPRTNMFISGLQYIVFFKSFKALYLVGELVKR